MARSARLTYGVPLCALLALVAALLVAPRSASAGGPHARTAQEQAIIGQLVAQVNGYRRQHGLPALRTNGRLSDSARTHSWRMAVSHALQHQAPGESGLGPRVSAVGYRWVDVGENIGYTSDRSAAGARQIIAMMYAEKAPDDSHRRNFLDRAYADLGMDVYDDPLHNLLWLTTDFGRR